MHLSVLLSLEAVSEMIRMAARSFVNGMLALCLKEDDGGRTRSQSNRRDRSQSLEDDNIIDALYTKTYRTVCMQLTVAHKTKA